MVSQVGRGMEMLRGSLIVLRRRCGKPNCRCVTEGPHETPALSWSQDGKTKMITLRAEQVREVRAAVTAYKKALTVLDRKAQSGLRELRRRQVAGSQSR